MIRLLALLVAIPVLGCATPGGNEAGQRQGGGNPNAPSWVLEVPNEPGERLYAVAMQTRGGSMQDVLEKARENLLDKAFAVTHRAGRLTSGSGRPPAMLRAALETLTSNAPRVITERYHDPRTGRPVIAVMVSLNFRMWHTAVYGFPPRPGDSLTQALLTAHARHGNRPFRPEGREIDEATSPAEQADAAPEPGRTQDGAEEEDGEPSREKAERSEASSPSVGAEAESAPEWRLSRPPGRIRVVVVAVPKVRDSGLEGWPSAAQDARLLADLWAEQSLAVRTLQSSPNGGGQATPSWQELEPDPQPRMLTGAQATRARIEAALTEAVTEAAAVVFVYLGRSAVCPAGEVVLLTAASERDRLHETGLPASHVAELAGEASIPGLVLLDGVELPANGSEASPAPELGWPTVWPASPGQEPYVDRLRGHGLVSYFATRGLQRGRADADGDGRTSLEQWLTYLRRNVAAASRHRDEDQQPWIAGLNGQPGLAIFPVE